VKNIASYFRIGDRLPLRVIEFDKEAKKIVLSAVEALKAMGPDAQEDYYQLHPVPQSGPAGSPEIERPFTDEDGGEDQDTPREPDASPEELEPNFDSPAGAPTEESSRIEPREDAAYDTEDDAARPQELGANPGDESPDESATEE
jgi:hypothetical protein